MLPSVSWPPHYETIASALLSWAQERVDVQAMLLVGSFARAGGAVDEWSDLDLILFVTDPKAFIVDSSWLGRFGQVVAPRLIDSGRGTPEWLVLYADGAKVDLMFVAAGGDLSQMLAVFPYQEVLRRGMVVLVDKTASVGSLPPPSGILQRQTAAQPAVGEFLQAIYTTLVIADKAVRSLHRGELWQAKMLTDADLKQQLLAMLAWHAQAHTGFDTWYEGRHMEEWADPLVLRDLPATFAAYNATDIRRALESTLALYGRLADATATRWGYPYPATSVRAVVTRIMGQ